MKEDKTVGFTFDCEDSEPEIVMLESHYNLMIKDIKDLEDELEYARLTIAYLVESAAEAGLDLCPCSDCVTKYITGNAETN